MYVVDRRTVVDQATIIVEQIRERLLTPGDPRWREHQATLDNISETLAPLAAEENGTVLGVSTLRGEFADNEEWKSDPARPAIIVGTVDMIGSKLLFNGYGDGRYWRAQHAGLIGQDSLVVLDEAHLTPAFGDLMIDLRSVQCQDAEPRPIQVMELSATSRAVQGSIFSLEQEDEKDQIVRVRLDAVKRLRLHGNDGTPPTRLSDVVKTELQRITELALEHREAEAKVLIYLRSPEEARNVVGSLKSRLGDEKGERVSLLTGTMRGHERDELVRSHAVYRAFLDPGASVKQTVYLVSTSAGEVGIDIDADHMICDLTTLDSMIQRLGRVNRRGGPEREARIDIVIPQGVQETDKLANLREALNATHGILLAWTLNAHDNDLDVSTRALRILMDGLDDQSRERAFAPKPEVFPATKILFDAWSLTTITQRMPGRPDVAQYLHGLVNDPPETYVAWRKEVALLSEAGVDSDDLLEWFQACRIEGRERLRDRTDRVKRTLGNLLATHRRNDRDRDFPVVLLSHGGRADWSSLSTIIDRELDLAYLTIVMPVEAGGLSYEGVLDARSSELVVDVAEGSTPINQGRVRERWLHHEGIDGADYKRLVTQESEYPTPGFKERERVTLQQSTEGGEDESHGRWLVLMTQPTQAAIDRAETAQVRQSLTFHEELIVERMNRITYALGLKGDLKDALAMAAKWHDRGKGRPIWQWYAGNSGRFPPLAKSTKYLSSKALGGYRHEFGSVMEAADDEDIKRHPESDLVLHLIAAHHGWSRPHFRTNAWRGIETHTTLAYQEMATEAMRRFGNLQQRYGRWGLAWLESLVRCADISASQGQEEGV